ncbi:MAG: hypothetical protein AB2L20_25725 [Mangrovibacterium sp.]
MRVTLAVFFLMLMLIPGQGVSQGLGFRSTQQSQISDRTSYVVFAEQSPKFRDELALSFQLSVTDPNSFGFICVVDAEKSGKNYAFAYIRGDRQTSYLKLSLKGEENLLTIPVLTSLLGKGKWIDVKLDFSLEQEIIEVMVNDARYKVNRPGLSELTDPMIYFGKHDNVIDVPSFAIRNLEVSNSREIFRFNLKEYTGNLVHDQDGNVVGQVENPVWLINDSYHWKHRFSYSVNDIVAVNYDSVAMKIVVAGKDSLVLFDMVGNTREKIPYANKLEVPLRLQTSFFDSGRLFVYEVNDVPKGRPTMASVDLSTGKWENNSFLKLGQQLHHHNAYPDHDRHKLTIFGGFGNNRLSNTFCSYDMKSDTWDTLSFSGDPITPRFFAGMGELSGQLLLFGGVGNKTGDQSLGKIYYYDCYSIDLKNKHIRKLWDIDRGNIKLVSTRDLIMSEDKSDFYTLCYPEYISKTYIKLYKYNIKTGEHVVLGDSIPIVSEEIQTNANLYLNSNTNELYCVVQEVRRGKTDISVYSIDNPPISAGELYVKPPRSNRLAFFLFGGGGIALVCIGGFVLLRKRKRVNANDAAPGLSRPPKTEEPVKNAVFIFGGFTVLNRNGQDCSHLFSPLVKKLFLIILLRQGKEEGITSEEIYDLLWPTKPQKNAKNLKGVSIHKLRTILSDLDGIELVLDKQHFRLQLAEPFYCDYFDLESLSQVTAEEIDDHNYGRLIGIVSRGPFLQQEDGEYFDRYKRDFADHLLVLVPDILKLYYAAGEFSRVIKLAGVLDQVDELNECAFYYTINGCLRLNDELSAKKHYNNYLLRYKKLQGEDYNILYPEVVRFAEKHVKKI